MTRSVPTLAARPARRRRLGRGLALASLLVPGLVGSMVGGGCSSTSVHRQTWTPSPISTGSPLTAMGYEVVAGAGYDSTGGPAASFYSARLFSAGTVTTWTAGGSLPATLGYQAMAAGVPGGRVHVAAGDSGFTAWSTTYSATIGASGAIATWDTAVPMSTAVSHPAFTFDRAGFLYLAGGSPYAWSSPLPDVWIGSYVSGQIASWTSGPPLPTSSLRGQLARSSGYLFYLGGAAFGSASSAIYRATVAGTNIGVWTTANQSLPNGIFSGYGLGLPGRIFVIGGFNGGNLSTVYSASVEPSGSLGAWETTYLPRRMGDFALVALPLGFSGYVYSIGGYLNSAGLQSSVYVAPFANGILGAWTSTLPLPGVRACHAAAF